MFSHLTERLPLVLASLMVLAIPALTFAILGNDSRAILAASAQSLLLGGAVLIIGRVWLKGASLAKSHTHEQESAAVPNIPTPSTAVGDMLPASSSFQVSASRDPSVEGWLDTGLEVTTGSFIALSVIGSAVCHTGEETGSGGHPELMAFNEAIGMEFPAGALVAKIGDDPQVYLLDMPGSLSVEKTGNVFLAVNSPTGEYSKAQGEFTVTITVL